MKIITGHQPVYLPWLGLFHKISLADKFVFMDDVQYLEQDWNNRNRIKGPQGAFWLTVPVNLKGSNTKFLKDIRTVSEGWQSKNHWQKKHWKSLQLSYCNAPYWDDHAPFLEDFYMSHPWEWLSELNESMLRYLLEALRINIEFIKASEFGFNGQKSDLVLDHCRKLNGTLCILGALGRDYINENSFLNEGISLHYQNYKHPVYKQALGEFISHLSIFDLLFNHGMESLEILKSGNVTREELETENKLIGKPTVLETAA